MQLILVLVLSWIEPLEEETLLLVLLTGKKFCFAITRFNRHVPFVVCVQEISQ